MIKVGIIGDIGSGKSFVAKQFDCPVFDADQEVSKIYQKDRICFKRLKKELPKYISSFPIKKNELEKNKNATADTKIDTLLVRDSQVREALNILKGMVIARQ